MKSTNTSNAYLFFIGIILFTLFAWVSNQDYKDEQVAEQHAQYVKQEVQDRKNELNRLALKGEKLTGFAGAIK